jgi:hypothetical protein
MALSVLKEIRKIYSAVNAGQIRLDAEKPVPIGLMASTEAGYQAMERFLDSAPGAPSNDRMLNVQRMDGHSAKDFEFVLCQAGAPLPPNGYAFNPLQTSKLIGDIVKDHDNVEVALARSFPQFRRAVSDQIIARVARENALFSLVTALPNVIPSIIDLPWAIGEFATDTAFLTMNQVRMALLMAAAHDRLVGYSEQKVEIAAIVGGAFGWRAVARELVGKIPLGGGLIPKAAVAYAGTYVVGLGLEKINRNGEGLSKWEKREAYAAALTRGKEVVREYAPSFAKRA